MARGSVRSRPGESAAASVQLLTSGQVLAAIRAHGEASYPEEACGGLLGSVRDETTIELVEAVASANAKNEERRRRYLIGPDDVLELERRAAAAGLEVVGYYHSHPDAPPVPSDFDRQHAWPRYTYLIVGVTAGRAGEARAWRLTDDRETFTPIRVNASGIATIEIEES